MKSPNRYLKYLYWTILGIAMNFVAHTAEIKAVPANTSVQGRNYPRIK
jgi:hypothetical protein